MGVNPRGVRKSSMCQVSCRATQIPLPTPSRCEVVRRGIVEPAASIDDLAHESALGATDADLFHTTAVLDGVSAITLEGDLPSSKSEV
jgi:hypothetical protein